MNLLDWKFTRRKDIKAIFDEFPNSTVIFRRVKNYYFVFTSNWSPNDPVVTKADLENMGLLINTELGLKEDYLNRRSKTKKVPE